MFNMRGSPCSRNPILVIYLSIYYHACVGRSIVTSISATVNELMNRLGVFIVSVEQKY